MLLQLKTIKKDLGKNRYFSETYEQHNSKIENLLVKFSRALGKQTVEPLDEHPKVHISNRFPEAPKSTFSNI